MEFFNVLNTIVPMDEAHWQKIDTHIEVKHYKKNEAFLKKDDPCNSVGFVEKGSFRLVMHVNGNERTFDFSVENEFVSDYYGMLQSKPASFDIIANQPATVACLPTKFVLDLFDEDMVYQKIGRTIAETEFCKHHERLTSLLYDSPQKRYQDLLKNTPEKVLQLPQHLLANYLGITKETLSRIRARK